MVCLAHSLGRLQGGGCRFSRLGRRNPEMGSGGGDVWLDDALKTALFCARTMVERARPGARAGHIARESVSKSRMRVCDLSGTAWLLLEPCQALHALHTGRHRGASSRVAAITMYLSERTFESIRVATRTALREHRISLTAGLLSPPKVENAERQLSIRFCRSIFVS